MKTKENQKGKMQAYSTGNEVEEEERESSPQLDTEMELEEERWAERTDPETVGYDEDESQDEIPEGRDYTKDF